MADSGPSVDAGTDEYEAFGHAPDRHEIDALLSDEPPSSFEHRSAVSRSPGDSGINELLSGIE